MSTGYGAPIDLFSVDPASGAETELADTSITNLLAELPVLETLAGGANPGLQLAGGTQVQFASTPNRNKIATKTIFCMNILLAAVEDVIKLIKQSLLRINYESPFLHQH